MCSCCDRLTIIFCPDGTAEVTFADVDAAPEEDFEAFFAAQVGAFIQDWLWPLRERLDEEKLWPVAKRGVVAFVRALAEVAQEVGAEQYSFNYMTHLLFDRFIASLGVAAARKPDAPAEVRAMEAQRVRREGLRPGEERVEARERRLAADRWARHGDHRLARVIRAHPLLVVGAARQPTADRRRERRLPRTRARSRTRSSRGDPSRSDADEDDLGRESSP